MNKCKNKPTKSAPLFYECPECGGTGGCPGRPEGDNGQGCGECNRTGKIYINNCPLETIPRDIWEFIDMAVLYLENGLPPIGGGQLDQAKSFLDGAKLVKQLREYYKECKT